MLNPFRRRTLAAADPPARTPPKTSGASGTLNFRGFLQSDEYNPDLQGDRALTVFDKMLRSDGSVQEAVEHIYSPVKNATVTVEPPDDPDTDELVAAALVRDAFFETLNQPWLEYIDQLLDYLGYGFQVFETSFHVVERELTYEVPGEFDTDDEGRRTPRTVTVPDRQYVVWDRFEQRLQRTIQKWHVERGRLLGVTQQVFNSDSEMYEFPRIDAENLLVLTNKRRGDDFTGRSLLRAAYKPWYLKELVEKIEVVALERWGCNIAVGYLPASQRDDAAALARLEDILANLKAGEATYLAFPGPRQTAGPGGGEGYLFELVGPTGTAPDFKSAKEYHRAEIKAAVLARFAELGHAQTGARSTGDTQSKVWYDALHAVARYIEDVHDPVIRRLVNLNLPGVKRMPRLVFSGLEAKDLAEFASAQSALVGSGAVRHDRSYRAWVREQIDAPPEDEFDDSDPYAGALTDPGSGAGQPGAPTRRGRRPAPGQQQLPIEAE